MVVRFLIPTLRRPYCSALRTLNEIKAGEKPVRWFSTRLTSGDNAKEEEKYANDGVGA